MSLSGTSIVSRGPPAKSSAVRHAHGTFPAHRQALVLYGSETGNAQEAAEDMGRMLQRLHFDTPVLCLDAVEPVIQFEHVWGRENADSWLQDTIANTAIVLIAISTAGQGEFPRNSRRLWNKLLRRNLPPLLMKDVNFAIFGLGDSSYPQ
jgi:sulfite reductase alpha subunit-like flavoprotein